MTRYAHHPLEFHCTAEDWLAAFSSYADPHFPPTESSPGVSDKPQGPDSVGFLLECPVCSIEMEVDAVTQHAPRFRRCPHCATRLFVSKADHDHDAFPFPILTVVQHDLHFPLWFPVQV